MTRSVPLESETIAKYCAETGEDRDDVHRRVVEFGEEVLRWKPLKNAEAAAYLWVKRQGREPPPLLDSQERCFFETQHGGKAEHHENPDGSTVVLCQRHKLFLCKSHEGRGIWIIGDYGFSAKNPDYGKQNEPRYNWLWFCEEHKPKREGLKQRRQNLRKEPYVPIGWKWDPTRGVVSKL